uniref:Neuromedin U C-terminal domain-containing protein n=1 Tax=Oryzias melastigma TaxID=30732 RepID=A0A3B3BX98_ORYME
RDMKTCHRQPAQRGAPSSSMSPPSTASITVAALLVLSIPACTDAVCTSYLHTDLKFWASDLIGELCVMMLVQNSKERRVEEDTKRTSELHPLLYLVSQLHTRRERELSMRAELQGPGGIESRGYFLYRPRNGRRSLEYE